MASYQNEEDGLLTKPTVQSIRTEEHTKSSRWGYLALAAGIAATTLLAVSSYDFQSTSAASNSIQMATEGLIKYSSLEEEDKQELFKTFKSKFSRAYESTDVESQKYINFKTFLANIDERNEAEGKEEGSTCSHGITKFADMSEEEFKKGYLGYKESSESNTSESVVKAKVTKYSGTETATNWANVYTTVVKDQGYCGSCWAFSVTEQLESDSIRLGLLTTEDTLSPEQIVQCDDVDDGCDGGNTSTGYKYVEKAGGLTYDSTYPYTSYYGSTGTCSSVTGAPVTVSAYYTVSSEDEMIDYVLATGPLSICLSASTWSTYTSGIMSVCPKDVDHCVQAVGIDTDNDYWIVRNSWGTEWGVDGYIYLKSGANTCNIEYVPTYVTPASV